MAKQNRKATSKESTPSKTKNGKITKPTTSSPASKKSVNAKDSKKIEQQLKEQKEEEKVQQEEKEFQLPSDSESDSEKDDQPGEDSEPESESEIAIHNDIISTESNKNSESNTKVSNKSGHTIITTTNNNKSSKSSDNSNKSKRGVIYIGRLPNGFEEKELRQYFQQFGEITRLRLSRNKKTGKSKHYAFIEFKDFEVAKIAVETMDNYLLMGHLLKCSLLANDKIHENLFVGANSKFKIIPYDKINQIKHDKKKSKEDWEKLNNKHLDNIKTKQESLKAMGIDFDINDL